MTFLELREVCKKGKVGLIPGWKGYAKYNYGLDELTFVNGDYMMRLQELESKLLNRKDLYFIL